MKCPYCGADNKNDAELCEYCGSYIGVKETEKTVINQTIYVNNTESKPNLRPQVVYVPVQQTVYDGKMKNKWVALFLCIFLGLFGGHKFYEGKTGMGILYLFTGGLFCIGWIIDIIVLAKNPTHYYV